MPRCPHCAASIPGGLRRCPECEEPLRPRKARSESDEPERGTSKSSSKRGGRRTQTKSMAPLYIGLGVCGGIALLVIVFLLAKKSSEDKPGNADAVARAEDRKQSTARLKQLGIALHNYHETYITLPPGGVYDLQGQGHHGWQTSLLPYVDQAPLFEQIDMNVPWNDPKNIARFQVEMPPYLRASDESRKGADGFAVSHWAANKNIMFSNSDMRFSKIIDGVSNTVFVGEVVGDFKPWGHPASWRDLAEGINQGPATFGNPSQQQALFLLGDGAVRQISEKVDREVLRKLSTPGGREAIGEY